MKKLEDLVRSRLRRSHDDISFALEKAREGNPFAAECSEERRQQRLQAKVNLSPREAEVVNQEIVERAQRSRPISEAYARGAALESGAAQPAVVEPPALPSRRVMTPDGREKVWGDTIDFVNVAFLEKGAMVARSVGRVAFRNGRPQGSGVLIGKGLFLTNHHVIESAEQAGRFVLEFDYERDLDGQLRTATRYILDPTVFATDPIEGLDFTIIAVGQRENGPGELGDFGFSGLSDAGDKHMIGEFANIVQHPNGRFKEVVLRENRLVGRFDDALHYVADTEPGSSGSAVYNSEWQMIALHHWGGPWIDGRVDDDPTDFEINEGIRISSIVRKLRTKLRFMSPEARARIGAALEFGENAPGGETRSFGSVRSSVDRIQSTSSAASAAKIGENGQVTWTFPVEVSVRIPHLADAQAALSSHAPAPKSNGQLAVSRQESDDYRDRQGYMTDFLEGFHIPLPDLGPGLSLDAARKIVVAPGEDPYELKYHHFSVVMNKSRKLAFFTACNIDGATAKSIGRGSRAVSDLLHTDPGLREAVADLQDAEADSWQHDPRLSPEDYSGMEIYEGQRVPGFPNPRSRDRIARMFQKGHLVRRIDPAWGDENQALAAELDTFHWTNAAPQVGFFNQGRADEDQPGTGRGHLWRAAENYVLRNAVAEKQRVISFTGPIFHDDDRAYRNIKIPGKFFKVTVWVENGSLKSLALIVDQEQVFREWPEKIGTREFMQSATEAEAFQDEGELDRVRDFLSTVENVEQLTELRFGDAVRDADIRSGENPVEVRGHDDLPLANDAARSSPRIVLNGQLDHPDGHADDLKVISGIGPKLEKVLNQHGVFHYSQIAAWEADEIDTVDSALRFRGRITREDWVGQAARLARQR